MCGIVGTIRFCDRVDRALLERQRDQLVHRGPDGAGLWCTEDGRVGLAHRRLAIIDLSAAGHQPMVDPATGCVVTFNGEIYNFRELRERLTAQGHRWRSQSDTEVLLAAYREWGTDCVEQLEGMFAFAIYDPRARRMLLARDRAGEKPLFYRHDGAQFTFASEAKALLLDPACPRRISAAALNEFLAYGYVTGGSTVWQEIRQLLPGTLLEVDLDTASVTSRRYWTLPHFDEAATARRPSTLDEAAEQLQPLLERAVRRQLVADVPVGILLSGGVDSSLITAMAARVSECPVRTFTVRFPDSPAHDEGPYARQVAEHFGTRHAALDAEPATVEMLRDLARQVDTPIADSSLIPTLLVSRAIRREATVALGGDGGDELFGGYLRYPALLQQEAWRARVPSVVRQIVAGSARRLWPTDARGHGWLDALAGDAGDGLAAAGRLLRPELRAALMPSLRRHSTVEQRAPERLRRTLTLDRAGTVARATALDFATYLPDDVLLKVDRASMLASLEVRAPFLDVDVIGFAFGAIPDHWRATRDGRKHLLRHLGSRLLPRSLDLTRKQGFAIPVSAWMRTNWRPLVTEVGDGALRPFVDGSAVNRLVTRLDRGDEVGAPLFALLMLGLWAEEYRISDLTEGDRSA